MSEGLLGGIAIHKTGNPLPQETIDLALQADATLMGAVGLPEFDTAPPDKRPEKGLLGLRKVLGVYANLRPVRSYSRSARFLAAQERPRRRHGHDHRPRADRRPLLRHTRAAFTKTAPRRARSTPWPTRAARSSACAAWRFNWHATAARRSPASTNRTCSRISQLWRRVVVEVAAEFPDVELDHLLVDNCAMQLVLNPRRFDVLLTENMFGDILSDEGAVLAGSIGMLPSASIGDRRPSGTWTGLYEPVHGSAPDIAGQNKANPFGAIGSVAAMLEYSFGLKEEAAAVNDAIEAVLDSGRVTADLKPSGKPATTSEVGDAVASQAYCNETTHDHRKNLGQPRRRGATRRARRCSTSICTWSTKSLRRRPSTACASAA